MKLWLRILSLKRKPSIRPEHKKNKQVASIVGKDRDDLNLCGTSQREAERKPKTGRKPVSRNDGKKCGFRGFARRRVRICEPSAPALHMPFSPGGGPKFGLPSGKRGIGRVDACASVASWPKAGSTSACESIKAWFCRRRPPQRSPWRANPKA